ncbi:MAG: type VI secretion system baseplate subunit TssK [bacterium]|nr:type VI secretion system baseplate subunit TssK [Candidatus Kapabacteria bacterium]
MVEDARQLPGAIQWHEGMLLTPQHFQQMSLRYDALLHYHTMMVAPHAWGIRRMKFDRSLLVNGVFRVLELEARMPDGLLISHASDDPDLLIDISNVADDLKNGAQTIYLVIAAHRGDTPIVNGDTARFESIESRPVLDYNTGDGAVSMPVLQPRLRLMIGDVPPARFVALPIARVSSEKGMYTLEDYIPPCISIDTLGTAAETLEDIAKSVAQRLREKARYLAEELRTRYYEMGQWAVLESKQKLTGLVEALPQLESAIDRGKSHPFVVYHALSVVAGHVTLLGTQMVPPSFSGYDHADPLASFRELRDYIFRMISEGVWESHYVVPFHLAKEQSTQKDFFSLRIEEQWLTNGPLMIGLRGSPEANERELVSWMQEAQIGSQSRLTSLIGRRVQGAPRNRIDDDSIVTARGLMLYNVTNDKENIVPNEFLQIINLSDRDDPITEILLLVPKERAAH